MITKDGKTYAHMKKLPLEKDYTNEFIVVTVTNNKFDSVNFLQAIFFRLHIFSALIYVNR